MSPSVFHHRLRGGFTLLELIVVIVILGILAALAIPTFSSVIDRSKDERSKIELEAVAREASALAAFGDGTGRASYNYDQLLDYDDPQALFAGALASGETSALASVVYAPGKSALSRPAKLPGALVMDDLSDDYGFFSAALTPTGEHLYLAMRSLNPKNCVFVYYNVTSQFAASRIAPYRGSGDQSCQASSGDTTLDKEIEKDPTPPSVPPTRYPVPPVDEPIDPIDPPTDPTPNGPPYPFVQLPPRDNNDPHRPDNCLLDDCAGTDFDDLDGEYRVDTLNENLYGGYAISLDRARNQLLIQRDADTAPGLLAAMDMESNEMTDTLFVLNGGQGSQSAGQSSTFFYPNLYNVNAGTRFQSPAICNNQPAEENVLEQYDFNNMQNVYGESKPYGCRIWSPRAQNADAQFQAVAGDLIGGNKKLYVLYTVPGYDPDTFEDTSTSYLQRLNINGDVEATVAQFEGTARTLNVTHTEVWVGTQGGELYKADKSGNNVYHPKTSAWTKDVFFGYSGGNLISNTNQFLFVALGNRMARIDKSTRVMEYVVGSENSYGYTDEVGEKGSFSRISGVTSLGGVIYVVDKSGNQSAIRAVTKVPGS